jgi:hypothetical protein
MAIIIKQMVNKWWILIKNFNFKTTEAKADAKF